MPTLNGRTYTYVDDFSGWKHAGIKAGTGKPVFPDAIFEDFLAEVLLQKAGIASINGLAPGAAGNIAISDGSNWRRSQDVAVPAVFIDSGSFAVKFQRTGGYPAIQFERMGGGGLAYITLGAGNALEFSGDVRMAASSILAAQALTATTITASGTASFGGVATIGSAGTVSVFDSGATSYVALRFNQDGVARGFIGADYNGALVTGVNSGDMVVRADGGSIRFSNTTTLLATINNNGLQIASGYALRLGVTYVAGAPAATGYITLMDAAGATYKVLVGT